MKAIAALSLILLGPSCGLLAPRADPTRYAVLASVDELPGETSSAASSSLSLGLGPVTLPEYVRRSEIVTREAGTRIVMSATERWAEPFDRAVTRVLAIDLQRATGAARIVHHPWYERDKPEVQVEIAFSRCEREESGRVVIAARWSVRALGRGTAPVERESRIERETAGPEGASTALAISQALADLCRDIAGSVAK